MVKSTNWVSIWLESVNFSCILAIYIYYDFFHKIKHIKKSTILPLKITFYILDFWTNPDQSDYISD